MTTLRRNLWTSLTDSALLAQCKVDTYRASGPGGQKRNKTSSAVRIRHPDSGLLVIAEESRSQHENRDRALRRLRQAFFLQIRDDLSGDLEPQKLRSRPDWPGLPDEGGRLKIGRKDPIFWPTVGLVLDIFQACQARLTDAAGLLGITTANLADFLRVEPKVWEQANFMRAR